MPPQPPARPSVADSSSRCYLQTQAAGAQRDAHGSGALAACGARQQQAADVRAHHEQERGHSPQQERECVAEGIAEREAGVGYRDEGSLRTRIIRVVGPMGHAVDTGELLLCLR
jgi:hypothetical protein